MRNVALNICVYFNVMLMCLLLIFCFDDSSSLKIMVDELTPKHAQYLVSELHARPIEGHSYKVKITNGFGEPVDLDFGKMTCGCMRVKIDGNLHTANEKYRLNTSKSAEIAVTSSLPVAGRTESRKFNINLSRVGESNLFKACEFEYKISLYKDIVFEPTKIDMTTSSTPQVHKFSVHRYSKNENNNNNDRHTESNLSVVLSQDIYDNLLTKHESKQTSHLPPSIFVTTHTYQLKLKNALGDDGLPNVNKIAGKIKFTQLPSGISNEHEEPGIDVILRRQPELLVCNELNCTVKVGIPITKNVVVQSSDRSDFQISNCESTDPMNISLLESKDVAVGVKLLYIRVNAVKPGLNTQSFRIITGNNQYPTAVVQFKVIAHD